MKDKIENNRTLKKALLTMLPVYLACAFVEIFIFTIDTLLAGFTLGSYGIAAVAIGLPAGGLGIAAIGVIIKGATLQMTWKLGRADNEAFNREFSCCMTFVLTVGFIILAILLFFSDGVAAICGGAKADETVLYLASRYIKWSAPEVPLLCVALLLNYSVGLLGYQKPKIISNVANIVTNIIVSTVLIFILPESQKVIALGIGKSAAALVQMTILLIFIKKDKVNIKFRPTLYKIKEFAANIRCGLPATCDFMFEYVCLAVINNIVLTFYPEDTVLLSVVSVVLTIFNIGKCGSSGTADTARYLFGVLFSSRDKDGLVFTLKNSIKYGTVVSLCWAAVTILFSPLLARLFGMSGEPMVQHGLLIALLFIPVINITVIMTCFYESTERFILSLLYAVIPDSVVFPCLIWLLIPVMGTDGIWVAMGGAFIVGLILIYLGFAVKARKIPVPTDKLLCLKKQITNRSPQLDVTIDNTNSDVCGISEKIYDYLNEHNVSRRTTYISALATEEIASDVVANYKNISKRAVDHMDVKIFVDEETIDIVIRIFGDAYNPLNYSDKLDEFGMCGVKLAAQAADKVSYSYVYKLNIITITLKK